MRRFLARTPIGKGPKEPFIDPLTLPFLELYLRSDTGTLNSGGTPATDGQQAHTWQDQSGKGRNAIKDVTSSNGPTLRQTGANITPSGLPTLQYPLPAGPAPNVPTALRSTITPAVPNTRGHTFYLIYKPVDLVATPNANTGCYVFGMGFYRHLRTSRGGDAFSAQDRIAARGFNSFGSNAADGRVYDDQTAILGQWQTICQRYKVPGDGINRSYAFEVWRNGTRMTPFGQSEDVRWNAPIASGLQFVVGAFSASGGGPMGGVLAAVVWFSQEHTDNQRKGVTNFLNDLFGL